MFLKVKGEDHLVRDTNSGAILNINKKEEENLKRIRRDRLKRDEEIISLKNEVSELKELVKQLLEKR